MNGFIDRRKLGVRRPVLAIAALGCAAAAVLAVRARRHHKDWDN